MTAKRNGPVAEMHTKVYHSTSTSVDIFKHRTVYKVEILCNGYVFMKNELPEGPTLEQKANLLESLYRRKYEETLSDILLDFVSLLEQNPDLADDYLEEHPQLLDDLLERGLKCLELELFALARHFFAFLSPILEEHPLCQVGYGDALFGLKAYEEAVHPYQATITLAPDIPDAYLSLAEVYQILGKADLAEQTLLDIFSIEELDEDIKVLATSRLGLVQESLKKQQSKVPKPSDEVSSQSRLSHNRNRLLQWSLEDNKT